MGPVSPSPERGRTRILVLVVLFVALVIAFAMGRASAPDDIAEAPPSTSTEPSNADTRDEASAVAAATRFSRVLTGPSGDADTYMDEIVRVAAPGWTDRARELAQNGIDFVTQRYGNGGTVEFTPVRYRVRSFSPEQAVIDLWGVVLGSGPKVGGIEESWVTGTLELQFVESEWKVSAQSSRGGPTPELLRTEESQTVDEILSDFVEYSDAEN